MQKSEKILKNLIKQEQKSEESINLPNSYHFQFPSISYKKSLSSFEESEITIDIASQEDVSMFEVTQKKSNKRKKKAGKSVKGQNQVKQQAVKITKQEAKIEKSNDSLSFELLKQEIPIGIDTFEPIPERAFKINKKQRRSGKSKKIKQQANEETKEQQIQKKEVIKKIEVKEESILEEPEETHIDYLTSICDFHIVDFKYHYRKQDFSVEKDVFYVFEPKLVKNESKKEDIPRQLILIGEKICESKELFGELIEFYRGLSRDIGLTKN